MVAVISGNGLGLPGTSLQQLGLSPGGQPGLGQSGTSQYVNIATGNLVLQSQDENLVEQGLGVGWLRTYNSLDPHLLGGFSNDVGGWLVGLARSLTNLTGNPNTAGSTITRDGGDGEEELFTYDATRGVYVATNKNGAEDTLQLNAVTHTATYIAGGTRNEEVYALSVGQSLLTKIVDGKAGTTYTLTYNSNNQITAVTASDGEALQISYTAQGRVASLTTLEIPPGSGTAVAVSRVSYTYDRLHHYRLSGISTALNPDDPSSSQAFTTTYTYDSTSNRVASLTQSDGLVVSYTYAQDANGSYRIATVTTGTQADGDAQTLTFSYDLADRTTTVTDASGRAWVYGYDASDNLTSVTSPAVNGQYQITRYTYTADGHVASVTDAAGNTTIYEYDAHGNRVLQRDADGNTITWTYNADDQVLSRTVYQVPDPDGSGSGQPSDPSTTWYVYDDGSDGLGHTDQLRYVIDADGDVSETEYNAQGQVSLTRSFAGAAYDISALSPNTSPTLSAMNTWAGTQDLTRTTRVDYAYDPSGRLTGKTAWDQVDGSGNGIADAGESITQYVYDAQGLLRQQVTERGADRTLTETTSYSYDGLGRLIGSTDALGHVTTWAYQAGGTLAVTYANGLVHTEVRNSAGELMTVTESATGQATRTTHYLYDQDGQLRATEAPDGAITYTFYDAAGRISGTVDAMGTVTEYQRDADGCVVETHQYATTVNTTNWLTNGAVTASTPTDITAVAPAASPNDRITFSLYDAAGLHVADVDAEGNVTAYVYDGAGNLIATTRYATTLSATQLTTLQSSPSWSTLQGDLASLASANDRTMRTFYDVANRAVATLDAAGDVTTTAYDAAGRVIKTTAYANALTAAQLATLGSSPSLSAVLADVSASANDQITRDYYDDRGQLIAQVDANGYLTTTAYDETTHITTTTRYTQALSSAQLAALTGHETLADLVGDVAGSASQISTQQYDADGELIRTVAADGTVTTYTYDAVGNLIGTTVTPPAGPTEPPPAAGNGLGLQGNSLLQLGQGVTSQYVNIATGNLVLQGQDERLIEQGLLTGLVRTYNSLGTTGDLGGAGGWLLGLDRKLGSVTGTLNTTGSTLTRSDGDGAQKAFIYDATRGLYIAANDSGAYDTLQWNASTSTWTYIAAGTRDEEIYNASGQLTGLTDGKSGASYTLTYNANNQLVAVTASDGEALELGYNAQGRVTTLSTLQIPAGGGAAVTESRVSYGYDSAGRLTSVTTDLTPDNSSDASVFTTSYTYDGTSTRIASLTQSDGLVVSYTYAQDANGIYRIGTVTTGTQADGDAQTLSFSYDLTDHTTTVSDASGRAWVYAYDTNGNLTAVTSPPVNGQHKVTSYTYTADGHVASVTDANGNKTVYEYDAHGNRTLQRDADGNTITWTYNTDDQVLTRTVYRTPDPDGSDPANAGQPSDPSTTWYVYDDGSDGRGRTDQLRYVIDADGDVSETQYGAQGQVSMTRAFAGAVYDTSALNPITASSLAALNTWASSQDLTATTRVDYAYDASGRLTGKTTWDQVDSSGAGIADAGEALTAYIYDAQGLLRQQVTERGANRTILESTSYSYDGLGRLIGSTDALGNVTTYTYTAGGTLTITHANGLVHTEVRNSAGELITVTESATGQATRTTHYLYDEDGQLRSTEDPSGAISYTFYDAAGRISGTVDAMGAVTQYVRDADGNIVETRQYATTVDTTSWLTNGAVTTSTPTDITTIVPAASATDRVALSLYDAAGLHVADVDAEGQVTTYGYDGAGNRVNTTQYATALGASQLGTLQTTPGWATLQGDLASLASANDRTSRTFYDVANRAVAMLDAAGYVTTTAYDAAGRVIKTTAYANDLTVAQRAALGSAPSLSAVLADVSASAGDQIIRAYYDDRGQLIAEVDAAGYLTTTTYDETTHSVTTTRYAQALSASQLSALTGHETLATLAGDVAGSTSQTTVQQYDADGQLMSATAVDGTVTTYAYDAAGHLTGTTVTPPASGQVRSTGATYDSFGDALTTTDGAGATTTNVYDALGRKVLTTDALGNSTWFFYDAAGRLVYTVKGIASGTTPNALGEVTAYTYNPLGEVTGTTRYAGRLNLSALGLTPATSLSALSTALQAIANPATDAVSIYTYTLDGLAASIKDGLGYATADTYDAFGDLASVQRQLSGAGQALSASNSTTTTYTYDVRGERTGEVGDAGGLNRSTGVSYDAFGRVTSRTDGNGNITTYSYDPLGRQISVSETVQGAVRTASTVYDAYNRIVSQTDAMGQTTVYQYSPDTRTVIVTTPDGVKLTTTKDAYGDTLSVTDALGNTTYYTYDGDGRLLTTTDALGNVTTEAYDADGDLLTSTDADGIKTTYTYDAAGRVLTRTMDQGDSTHLNLTTACAYDGRGQTLSVTDPEGVVTTYAYDADGHVLTTVQDYDAAGNNLNLTTTYTWDGAGEQLSITQGAGTSAARTTQYAYDKLGRLTQTVLAPGTGHLNLTTRYAYDANNNLIAKTDPDGNVTRYVYDEANEQVYGIDAGGGVTQTWHDADGRVTSTRRYATALSANQLSALGTTPSYTQVAAQVTASANDEVSYTVYNNDGQPAYTIDPLGNVTETRYDAAGRVSETLAYANALSASTLASLQASLQQGAAQSSMAGAISDADNTDQNAHDIYTYYDTDGRVRFTAAAIHVDGTAGFALAETRYDATGRISASILYGDLFDPSLINSSTDEASLAAAVANSTNQRETQYFYDAAGRQVATEDPNGDFSYTFYDADGNISATVDAAGDVVAYTRDAAGRVLTQTSYATSVDTTGWLTTSAGVSTVTALVLPASNTDDRVLEYDYDSLGRVVTAYDNVVTDTESVWDPTQQQWVDEQVTRGKTTVYAYDAASNLVQTTETDEQSGDTRATRYFYDADGNNLATLNADGYLIQNIYDANGRLTETIAFATAVDPDLLAAGTLDQILPAANSDDQITSYYHDAMGNTIGVLDADGYFTSNAYDGDDRQVSSTRYAAQLTVAPGTPIETLEAAVEGSGYQETTKTYDAYGNVRSSSNAEGTVTTNSYDEAGRLTSTTVAAGTSDSRTSSYTYDALGNLTSVTDGNGAVTQYAYDVAGNRISSTDALDNTTWYVYDAMGRQVYVIRGVADSDGVQNALGDVVATDYDAFGDVIDTVEYTSQLTIDSGFAFTLDNMQSAVAGLPNNGSNVETDYVFDTDGRLVEEDVGRGENSTQYEYDAFGERTQEEKYVDYSDEQETLYSYDDVGNLLSAETDDFVPNSCNPDSGQSAELRELSWTYDAFDRVVTSTDGDGTTTTSTYDQLNRKLSDSLSVQGQLRQATSTYDAHGRVLTRTDALGLVTSYAYDDVNRSMTMTSPGGLVTVTVHNREGQTISTTDAAGNTTQYAYDGDGRLLQTTAPDGSITSNQYDQVGNLISTDDADGHVVAYTYDATGKVLTQTVDPDGLHLVTTYAYDGRDQKLSVTDPTGAITSYFYDNAGRVSEVDVSSSSQLDRATDYYYDGLNDVVQTYVGPGGGIETSYTYDVLGRLLSEQIGGYESIASTHYADTMSVDYSGPIVVNYAYDADGNLISKTDGNGDTTYYVYNEAGEQVYSITPVGIIGEGSTRYGAVTQTWYDADGRLVATCQYATTIDSSTLDSLASDSPEDDLSIIDGLVTTSPDDRTSYKIYDSDGRVRFAIDPTGAVTETRYNAAGQVSETLAYSAPITVSDALADELFAGTATSDDVEAALALAGATEAGARIAYTYYDTMGRVRFVVTPTEVDGTTVGVVTEERYDQDGNVTAQIEYGQPIDLSQVGSTSTTASIAAAVASIANQRTTESVYDTAGRLVYTIDAFGAVTERQYDDDGRLVWTFQYANAIALPAEPDIDNVGAAVDAANPDDSDVRGTGSVYDDLGRVTETLDTLSDTPTGTYVYDEPIDKPTSYTNRDGATWTYDYDNSGRLVDEQSPEVAVASYASDGTYQAATQESVVTDYSYDGDGNILSKTEDAWGQQPRTTQYYYDTADNLIQTIYPDPGQIDPATGVFAPTGTNPTSSTTFDAFGEAVVSCDVNGNYSYKVYDQDGRLAYDVDADGYVTGYAYDTFGDQTVVTRYATPLDTSVIDDWNAGQPLTLAQIQQGLVPSSDEDRTLTTTYDSRGNKLSITQSAITYANADGTTATGSPVTQFTYDAYGNVTSQSVLIQGTPGQSDAVWATTYSYYDQLGQKTMTVDPMGSVTTWNYDSFGEVSSTTEWANAIATSGLTPGGAAPLLPPAGDPAMTGYDRTTQYTYDSAGNKIGESTLRYYAQADGSYTQGEVTTTYGYDGENRVTSVDANGQVVNTQYDALGRVLSVTGGTHQVLSDDWQQILAGDVSLSIDDPSLYIESAETVAYTYDAFGDRLLETRTASGSALSETTYNMYDGLGRVIVTATPLAGQLMTDASRYSAYDNAGNLVHSWYTLLENTGRVIVDIFNTYDASGNRTSSETLRSGQTRPDAYQQQAFDAFGEVIGRGDDSGIQAGYVYDQAGNMVQAPDGKTGAVHQITYNLAGQVVLDANPLASAVGGDAVTRNVLDLDGRVVQQFVPSDSAASGQDTNATAKSYDRWGNVASATDLDGNTTTYTYDDRNHVIVETEAAVTVVDAHGAASTQSPVKQWSYDANGNLIGVEDENGHRATEAYDAVGNVVQTTDATGASTYTFYDALGRAVATEDADGNISFKDYDALDRVIDQGVFELSADGTSRSAVWQQAYQLDIDGNRMIVYDGVGSALLQAGQAGDALTHAWHYDYDSQGHVIESQDADQWIASEGGYISPPIVAAPPDNADFEQGNTGWQSAPDWTIEQSSDASQGSWCAAYSGSGTQVDMLNDRQVPVTAGQAIKASCAVVIDGDPDNHGGGAVLIAWYDSQGNLLSVSVGNAIAQGESGQRSTVTAQAPSGAAYAVYGFQATNWDHIATVYVDDCKWDATEVAESPWNPGDPVNIVAGTSSTPAVEPLPTNPDFEEGDTGWSEGTGWAIGQYGKSANGTMAAQYTGTTSQDMVNANRASVIAGQSITASCLLSINNPQGTIGAAVRIIWFDANGNQIGYSQGNVISSPYGGAWQRSSVTAFAPTGAVSAAVAVNGDITGGGAIYADSVSWNYQYQPPQVQGPSLEQTLYTYDVNGNKTSQTTADGDTQSWTYDYFGRVVGHTDLSGATYHYDYDADSGQLTGEDDNWSAQAQGQSNPSYVPANATTADASTTTYYADGHIASVTYADGSSSQYRYDANGNVIWERATTVDGTGQTVDVLTQTTYDSHNRIAHVTSTNESTGVQMLDETFTYDADGNRRSVSASSGYGGATKTAWFTYDADSRVAVVNGKLSGGNIVLAQDATSYSLAYDGDGNAVTRTFLSDGSQVSASGTLSAVGDVLAQMSVYDANGNLVRTNYALDVTQSDTNNGVQETRSYDANEREVTDNQVFELGTKRSYTDPETHDPVTVNIGGWLESATGDSYDQAGHLTMEQNFGRGSGDWVQQIDQNGEDGNQSTPPATYVPGSSYGPLALQTEVTYEDANGNLGYDAAGNVTAYQYEDATSGRIDQYTVKYLKKDGYLEAATSGTSNTQNVHPATDESVYDERGERIALTQHVANAEGVVNDTVRVFAYNGEGEILTRRDGELDGNGVFTQSDPASQSQHYTYVEGAQVASEDEAGTLNVLDAVTAFSNSDTGTQGYVVQAGDTLQGIAQAIYGDASLWYVIADANGLQSDSDLVAGQTLTVPQVRTNSNSATTFKPYDPNQITGSTTPTLPSIIPPPPAHHHHCGALAAIIVIAVTVIVTVLTYGATSELLEGELGYVAGAATAGAVAGVAGNLAGQVVGDAEGIHHGISLNEALDAGIVNGITMGVGEGLTQAGISGVEAGAIEGAANYVGQDIAGKLTGQPSQFSWAGLVASAVGSAVASSPGLSNATEVNAGRASFGSALAGGIVQGAVTREVSSVLGDNRVQTESQILEGALGNAIGSAIGNPIADDIKNYQAEHQAQQAQQAQQQAEQQAELQANVQKLQAGLSAELQGDIDAQTGQAIQAQFASAPAQGNAVAIGYQTSKIQGPNPAAPAAGASIPPLPNGDAVDAKGNVYKDGALVGQLKPVPGKDFQPGAFKYGDRTALVDLLSGMSPGSDFDAGSYDPILAPDGETLPWSQAPTGFDLARSGFDPAVGSYGDTGASLFTMFNGGSTTTYNTPLFNPTAAPNIALPYGINNDEINAEIARSPTTVAELNEAEANGVKIELTMGADYDAKDGVIEIPASEANDPSAIVQTLAHELGHVMWGDDAISQDQALAMGQRQFLSQQLSAQLQNEGVATINNIAVAEQIWPNDPNVIADHVDGAQVKVLDEYAATDFAAGYDMFAKAPSMDTLGRAAGGIGKFYGQYESPANDPHETYAQYYTSGNKEIFLSYQVNAAGAARNKAARDADALYNSPDQTEYERAMQIFHRLDNRYKELKNAFDTKYGAQHNGGGGA